MTAGRDKAEDVPQDLRDAVAQKFGRIVAADWNALQGGRTNRAWRLSDRAGGLDLVVKLYTGARENPLFPNLPDAEYAVMKALAPLGMAPKPLAHLETRVGTCLVYEYAKGKNWCQDAGRVGALLRRVHQVSPPAGLRHVPNGSAEIIEQALQLSDRPVAQSIRHLSPIPPTDQCALLHGDVVAGNLVQNTSVLRLIDWQCPAIGDPCDDISHFLSPAMQWLYRGEVLSVTERAAFFTTYSDPAITARYSQLSPWYHHRMLAYCDWQVRRGQKAYAEAADLEAEALQRSISEYPK